MNVRGITITALGAVSFLVLLFVLLGLVFSEALMGDSASINLAGQQRYRTYRFAYLTERMDSHPSEEETLARQLRADMEAFEKILHGLKYGDKDIGLIKASDTRVINSLDENSRLWKEVKRHLAEHMSSPAGSMMERHRYFGNEVVPVFLESLDRTVSLLDTVSAAKVMRFKEGLVVVAALSFVTLGFITTILQRRIHGPLSEITAGVKEIRSGNFDRRIAVEYDDELGALAGAYNEMTMSLGEMIRRYRDLAETIPVAVIEFDRNGDIRYLNKMAIARSGWPERELNGKNFREFIPEEDRSAAEEAYGRVLSGATLMGLPTRLRLKEGASHVELNIVPIRDGEDVTGFRCVVKDVEKTMRMMDDIEKARLDAEETSKKLRKTVEDLEEFSLIAVRREMKMQEIRQWLKGPAIQPSTMDGEGEKPEGKKGA
ncbi:MAG: PAS domain S-box protein [Deltaproteobacteria bacterium]|nr:PAS domain S-box protein [Deltaproteobacteria bacterium]